MDDEAEGSGQAHGKYGRETGRQPALHHEKANEAAEVLAIMDSKKAAKISEALTQR